MRGVAPHHTAPFWHFVAAGADCRAAQFVPGTQTSRCRGKQSPRLLPSGIASRLYLPALPPPCTPACPPPLRTTHTTYAAAHHTHTPTRTCLPPSHYTRTTQLRTALPPRTPAVSFLYVCVSGATMAWAWRLRGRTAAGQAGRHRRNTIVSGDTGLVDLFDKRRVLPRAVRADNHGRRGPNQQPHAALASNDDRRISSSTSPARSGRCSIPRLPSHGTRLPAMPPHPLWTTH